ncbi:MAG: hypothetical protein E4H20_06750 [Spirochaetales bacterium]|nr:MAG: hypothetical protein E4H20_06750 [Spirochaetales bacterium]
MNRFLFIAILATIAVTTGAQSVDQVYSIVASSTVEFEDANSATTILRLLGGGCYRPAAD